jgi:enoyl-CoA hydratase/carnithine racemase
MSKSSHGFNRSTDQLPDFEFLLFSEDNDVARITLNRPEVVNALSVDLSREFYEAVE